MQDNMQALLDILMQQQFPWEEIVLITAGIFHPKAQLEMAMWLEQHSEATWEEIMSEKTYLIEEYQI